MSADSLGQLICHPPPKARGRCSDAPAEIVLVKLSRDLIFHSLPGNNGWRSVAPTRVVSVGSSCRLKSSPPLGVSEAKRSGKRWGQLAFSFLPSTFLVSEQFGSEASAPTLWQQSGVSHLLPLLVSTGPSKKPSFHLHS